MTSGERMARIDREFERTFGVFDGRMRDEQSVIAGQRGGRGGSGGGQGAGNGSGSEAGDGAAGDKGEGGGEGKGNANGKGQSGQGQGGQGQGSKGQGTGGNGQTGGGGYGGGPKGGGGPSTSPADIPDGSDDDVVARQLREAATNETDPELRDKLWQEYRNYKKSAG